MAELHRAAEATRAVLRTWVRCEFQGAWEGRTASCWRLGCDSGMHGDGGGEALPNENEKSVISAPAASHSRTRASWWGSAYLLHMPPLPAHVLSPAPLQRCPGCPFAIVHWHQCHGGGGGHQECVRIGPPGLPRKGSGCCILHSQPGYVGRQESGPFLSLHFARYTPPLSCLGSRICQSIGCSA